MSFSSVEFLQARSSHPADTLTDDQIASLEAHSGNPLRIDSEALSVLGSALGEMISNVTGTAIRWCRYAGRPDGSATEASISPTQPPELLS